MRAAFATSDGVHVNEQFRRASHLAVYRVSPSSFQLEEVHAFAEEDGLRSSERIRAIEGATIVFVAAMGPSSAARLAARGIHPATAPAGTPIEDLLEGLSRMLASRTAVHAR